MFFSEAAYLGIDPTAGRKPFAYAAVDDQLRLTALGKGSLDEVLAFTAGQQRAIVAVCAPPRPSQHLMRKPEVRDSLNPAPRPGRWMDFRLVEYLLRQHRISCYKTPAEEKACPNWMKMGFHLYRRLERMGFKPYPAERAALQWLEVYPHASYCSMLGWAPLPKNSLEGRLQRQLVLHDHQMDLPDPIQLIQGITHQQLLEGSLAMDSLYAPGALDALVAAYTAWQAGIHPKKMTALGDASEGLVFIPVPELKRHY